VPISDKNRKILWGKSGNRCAICRRTLVVDATGTDSESVVGDECHIVSSAKGGPRHDPDYSSTETDELPNLMLLCRIHHKMIDDQAEKYSTDILRSIKANHEKWVSHKLTEDASFPPVKIHRTESEIPKNLPLIKSGKELSNLAAGCFGVYKDYSDGLDDDETELVGSFIQHVSDLIDIFDNLGPLEKMRSTKALDEEIKSLAADGFMVFATVERQRLEGGAYPPSEFRVLHLSVKRESEL